MARLMGVPDLWNHYAASVYRARLPRTLVPLPRGRRLAGESKMNFVSLLIHGLSAMSVFSDQVSARLLTAAVSFAVIAIALMGVTAGIRWFTDLAVPGWATFTVGLLLVLVVQLLSFATQKVGEELAYLDRPLSRGFERPYGWGWLLYLHLEATRHDEGWSKELEPLARAFAHRLSDYLPLLTYPIRVGTHFNTAFAMVLSLEWAERFDPSLAELIRSRSLHWFAADRDCQAWEPGGDEFLSPSLIEALCMARNHPAEFPAWFGYFLPGVVQRQPATIFEPAIVSDRSDGKIAHLDGLNLSRAWCWRGLAPLLPSDVAEVARCSADEHLAAALPHIAGDYMGEHWLASFALLALLSPEE